MNWKAVLRHVKQGLKAIDWYNNEQEEEHKTKKYHKMAHGCRVTWVRPSGRAVR